MQPRHPYQQVLAFDPGETTGVVLANLTGPRTYEFVEAWQLKWPDRFQIKDIVANLEPRSIIVAEDFHLYAAQARNQINSYFPSVKVLGIIETWANEFDFPVVLQPASARVNTKVPESDYPNVSGRKHAIDAYQHLRYWVLTKGAKFYTAEPLDALPRRAIKTYIITPQDHT